MDLLHTDFELQLPGVPIEQVRERVAQRRARPWSVSELALRDDHLHAFFLSNTAPVLRARLLSRPEGVVIRGQLRWTRHLRQTFLVCVAGIGALAFVVFSDSRGAERVGVTIGGSFFALAAAITAITYDAVRDNETARMKSKLREALS